MMIVHLIAYSLELLPNANLDLPCSSQTNSGKTHTMTGSPKTNESGIIRLAVEDIFRHIQTQSCSQREYLLRVSYLEIYNEQIYDLLAPQSNSNAQRFGSNLQHHHLPPSTSVRIFESRTEGVQIRGLREEIVTCPSDVFSLLDLGDARRKVGSTGMNSSSSRSHSVFRLVLESRVSSSKSSGPFASSNSSVASDADSVTSGKSSVTQSLGTAVKGPVRISSLSLVDLAGSESVKATGSIGVRQKEGQYINKSLLTLGHVVHKLSEMSARAEKESNTMMPPPKEHIPYRDSKLTRLLQPSLGGNARVCIICNVSPAAANVEESHNTLKFGSRAKTIQQHASITEIADEKTLLRSYREEIEELKRQLREARKSATEATVQTPAIKERTELGSSSDDEDQDDTHVLVLAIKNLESLILKTGAKSTVKKTAIDGSSPILDANGMDVDGTLPSRRSLDADLKKVDDTDADLAPEAEPEENGHLIKELHRIQHMLGTVMKKRRDKPPSSMNGKNPTPDRDEEVEKLRIQLQEQQITSTMRKADSSFLQNQLAEKQSFVEDLTKLLDDLEKRQNTLELENAELKKELAAAKVKIDEGDKERAEMLEKLSLLQNE
jgi:centromeric protein E